VHLAQILLVLLAKASTSATESTVNKIKSQIYFLFFSGILDFGKLYYDRDAIFLHLEHVAYQTRRHMLYRFPSMQHAG
jgi:hypothetical protein